MISGQSDTEANLLPDLYRFVWIQFQINHFRFFVNTTFIHRQGATDYKAHGSDVGGEVSPSPSRPKITVAYAFISSRFRPSLTGLAWLT